MARSDRPVVRDSNQPTTHLRQRDRRMTPILSQSLKSPHDPRFRDGPDEGQAAGGVRCPGGSDFRRGVLAFMFRNVCLLRPIRRAMMGRPARLLLIAPVGLDQRTIQYAHCRCPLSKRATGPRAAPVNNKLQTKRMVRQGNCIQPACPQLSPAPMVRPFPGCGESNTDGRG